jgi:hypothetical protein
VDQGSGRSFEELFAAAYGRLVGLLFAFLHDRAQAEDVSRTPSPLVYLLERTPGDDRLLHLLPLAGTTPATDGDDLPVAGRLLAGRLVATQPAPCRPA